MVIDQTVYLLERQEEIDDCIQVMSDVMDLTFDPATGPHQDDLDLIIKKSLRMVIQTAVRMDKSSKQAVSVFPLNPFNTEFLQ